MKLLSFQQYLKKNKINLAFLVHPDINITYLTQREASFAFLLIFPQRADFYLSKLDFLPKLKRIRVKRIEKGWEDKLKDKKVRKVGINKENLSVAYLEKLKKIFPRARFVDVSDFLKKLRSQKTNEEMGKIKRACKITDSVFQAVRKGLEKKAFSNEKEVGSFIDEKINEEGGELAFPTIVASGSNSAIPHHITSSDKLRKGFLLLDFGAKFEGYCSDLSRTLYLGEPSQEEKEKYSLLLRVQEKALARVKENINCQEIDNFTRKELGKFSSHFIHSLGHGVGREIHEAPSLSKESKDKLKSMMIFTIEPGLYFPGKFGIRIEDTVWLNGKKVEVLTKSPKTLIKRGLP